MVSLCAHLGFNFAITTCTVMQINLLNILMYNPTLYFPWPNPTGLYLTQCTDKNWKLWSWPLSEGQGINSCLFLIGWLFLMADDLSQKLPFENSPLRFKANQAHTGITQWPRDLWIISAIFIVRLSITNTKNFIANSLKLTTSMKTERNVKIFLKGTAVVALNTDRFSPGLWKPWEKNPLNGVAVKQKFYCF